MMPTSKILLRKIKPVLMKREIEFLRQLSVADGELFQLMVEGFVQIGYFAVVYTCIQQMKLQALVIFAQFDQTSQPCVTASQNNNSRHLPFLPLPLRDLNRAL